MPHLPHSPDLTPCDFSLFLELDSRLQHYQFESADEVRTALQFELKNMAKNGF